jgi:hypothetical protein
MDSHPNNSNCQSAYFVYSPLVQQPSWQSMIDPYPKIIWCIGNPDRLVDPHPEILLWYVSTRRLMDPLLNFLWYIDRIDGSPSSCHIFIWYVGTPTVLMESPSQLSDPRPNDHMQPCPHIWTMLTSIHLPLTLQFHDDVHQICVSNIRDNNVHAFSNSRMFPSEP